MALLEVTDLHVSFGTADGTVQAVRGLTFQVDQGQTLAIVGESGSGKTVTTQTITGLVPGARVSGRAVFDGIDLLGASPHVLRGIRGARIGMIFQDPLSSLHPYYQVGWQIVEMIRAHDRSISKRRASTGVTSTTIPYWVSGPVDADARFMVDPISGRSCSPKATCPSGLTTGGAR